jgi:hypothetical protein
MFKRTALLTLLVSIALAAPALAADEPKPAAEPNPAAKAAAEPRPVANLQVPALVVGDGAPAEAPKSFVVDGVMRASPAMRLAYSVATDGTAHRCALIDLADGTPLFISDGSQTLAYDLAGNRIVLLRKARGSVGVDWEHGAAKPASFGFAVEPADQPIRQPLAFRIDRFLDDRRDTLVARQSRGFTVYGSARREAKAAEGLTVDPANPPTWFEFQSRRAADPDVALQVKGSRIGMAIPPEALAFPDIDKLAAAGVTVATLQPADAAADKLVGTGTGWFAKFAANSDDPRMRAEAAKLLPPNPDWTDLARRDAELGKQYREALAKQGIRFAMPKAPAASADVSDRPAK